MLGRLGMKLRVFVGRRLDWTFCAEFDSGRSGTKRHTHI